MLVTSLNSLFHHRQEQHRHRLQYVINHDLNFLKASHKILFEGLWGKRSKVDLLCERGVFNVYCSTIADRGMKGVNDGT